MGWTSGWPSQLLLINTSWKSGNRLASWLVAKETSRLKGYIKQWHLLAWGKTWHSPKLSVSGSRHAFFSLKSLRLQLIQLIIMTEMEFQPKNSTKILNIWNFPTSASGYSIHRPELWKDFTIPKANSNLAPENIPEPSLKRKPDHLPTMNFKNVSFREGR